jgi:hypothetical protein
VMTHERVMGSLRSSIGKEYILEELESTANCCGNFAAKDAK